MADDLTIAEAAAVIKVSPSTIKREIACGRLVATRYRGCTRIARADLEEYRKQCRSGATEGAGKFGFSMAGKELAALLRLDQMPSSSKGDSGKESTTTAQVVPLPTRSKKLSTAG